METSHLTIRFVKKPDRFYEKENFVWNCIRLFSMHFFLLQHVGTVSFLEDSSAVREDDAANSIVTATANTRNIFMVMVLFF